MNRSSLWVCACLLLGLALHPHLLLGPPQVVVFVLCAMCELNAARLPVAGRWSAGWALCLGSASPCPSSSAVILLLAVALRSLQSGSGQATRYEVLETLVPASLSLMLLSIASHWALAPWLLDACSLVVWLSVWLSFTSSPPAFTNQEEASLFVRGRRGLARRQLGMALLGWCLGQALLLPAGIWLALPLGLAALAFQVHEIDARRWVPVEERTGLEHRLEKSEQDKQNLNASLAAVRGELQTKLDERLLLEELTGRLAQYPDLAGTGEVIMNVVQRLLNCQSCVLFWVGPQGCEAAFVLSPHRDRLMAQPLLQHPDWLLQEAALGRPAQRSNSAPSALFPDETYALALPVGREAVLYAGGLQAWPKDSLGLLQLVANQASVALWVARRFQHQQQDLKVQVQTNRQLQAYVEGVGRVLHEIQKLLADLEPNSLIEQLPGCIQAVFGGDFCALVLDGSVVKASQGDLTTVLALCGQARSATWWEDLRATRLAPPRTGAESAIVAPLLGSSGEWGAIYVGGPVGAFQQEMIQWLEVFAFLFGGLLHSSRLHAELVSAYQALQSSQAQVAQASKMAAVGQLAAGVAHEINNPLAAILLAIDSASKMKDRPQLVEKLLSQARSAAVRCTEIVSKLLYYSREARLGKATFALADMIKDTLDLVGRQLQLDGVQVVFGQGPDGLEICANQNGLHQVLLNLLLNARDAVLEEDARERTIDIHYGGDRERVWFEVEDRGCGMDPSTLSRCLEPFFTTKPVGRGTGLGLSVCQQIVSGHGGDLEIDSQPGSGTRIRVNLPVQEVADE